MVADYVAAAVRAEQAGFDGVEVHGAHGFLLAQFLDRRNQRPDRYGGTLDHRMRALVEVLDGIRAATGDDFQVGVRLSPEAHGSPLEEGREIARQILTVGVVDFVDMSLRDVLRHPPRTATTACSSTPSPACRAEHGAERDRPDPVRRRRGLVPGQGRRRRQIGTGAILHHDFAARALADPEFTSPTPAGVSRCPAC